MRIGETNFLSEPKLQTNPVIADNWRHVLPMWQRLYLDSRKSCMMLHKSVSFSKFYSKGEYLKIKQEYITL